MGHCDLTIHYCGISEGQVHTASALACSHHIYSLWDTGPNSRQLPGRLLRRSSNDLPSALAATTLFVTVSSQLVTCATTNRLGGIACKVQARTSAGVNSSIALIPEEDHDEQDEQSKTTDDNLP